MLPESIPQGLETGRTRDLMHLTDEDFDIWEIAQRLAKINRFCGATKFPLSVATHSVVVSYLAPAGRELTGLLHDISESFGIGDMISPVKKLNPAFKELEAGIVSQLLKPFPCLAYLDLIEHVDKRATALEALTHRGSFPDWAEVMGAAYPVTKYEQTLIQRYYAHEWDWDWSANLFADRYDQLVDPCWKRGRGLV